jgi:hypothetical protein
MELENYTLSSLALSALVLFVDAMIPGALPQARDKCCAFGAEHL